jgi:hypothetical protein
VLSDDLPPDKLIMGPAPYSVTENKIELSTVAKEQKMRMLRERTGSDS